jgi:hypothetical protein
MQAWPQAVDEAAYRQPLTDEEPEAPDTHELDDGEDPERVAEWHAMPGTRVLLGVFVGGWLYQTYWMYCWWQYYRHSQGYARAAFWRAVYRRTGYQVSPFWRACFGYGYVLCLFTAVAREAKLAKVPSLGAPLLLTLVYNISTLGAMLAGSTGLLVERAILALLFLGTQLTVNRLNQRSANPRPPSRATSSEVVCLIAGGSTTLWWFAERGP